MQLVLRARLFTNAVFKLKTKRVKVNFKTNIGGVYKNVSSEIFTVTGITKVFKLMFIHVECIICKLCKYE